MALLSLQKISLAFGGPPLLEEICLQMEAGERISILGRNGTGKSTLMKIISGEQQSDSGEVVRRPELRVARLGQDVPEEVAGSIFEVIASGLGGTGELLRRYHQLSLELEAGGDDRVLERLGRVQHELEAAGGWELQQRVGEVLSHLELPAEAPFAHLSGGLKRRVLLGRALVQKPDLLLLDEPTNHLDLSAIAWLEDFLLKSAISLIFVTHDRAFMQRLATRIVELDRGRLFDWACDYPTFLTRKEALLSDEQKNWDKFDKKLAQEEVWIRQGIKARRTRNEGRVRALKKMRDLRLQRRERTGKARMQIQEAGRSGKRVIEAENVSYRWGDREILRDFSVSIQRGDKIGIIGPNGSGKTSLLRLLLGDLEPESGSIRLGTNLEVCYFDQMRSRLEPERTVQENLSGESDTLVINGVSRHVLGYLKDFLFTPDRARSPVRILSGGERNRLLLAKLFTLASNVLVLDEPTNDLDMETLELLEELVIDYPGTLLVVSHDRAFLNNVVTSTLVFEGQGLVREYVGGYDDWQAQRAQEEALKTPVQEPAAAAPRPQKIVREKERKLSFKEKQELESLPARMEALEAEQAALHEKMSDPDFYKTAAQEVAALQQRLARIDEELESAYARWAELEELA